MLELGTYDIILIVPRSKLFGTSQFRPIYPKAVVEPVAYFRYFYIFYIARRVAIVIFNKTYVWNFFLLFKTCVENPNKEL